MTDSAGGEQQSAESLRLFYLADTTGLFVTMMFNSQDGANATIYAKLLSDSLPADLGYLYKNAVAQMIASLNRNLYFRMWAPQGKVACCS